MYKSKIETPCTAIGESIEEKIRKASSTNTPLESISPMIYTDAKDGVRPEFDIRTDRFDVALDAIDHYQASEAAKGDGLNVDNDIDVGQVKDEPNTD